VVRHGALDVIVIEQQVETVVLLTVCHGTLGPRFLKDFQRALRRIGVAAPGTRLLRGGLGAALQFVHSGPG